MNVRGPVGGVPVGGGDEISFGVAWGGRWGMEFGRAGLAGFDGPLHFVVDGADGVFGDVGAFLDDFAGVVGDFGAFDVFAFDYGEGVHVVVDRVARGGEHRAELGLAFNYECDNRHALRLPFQVDHPG